MKVFDTLTRLHAIDCMIRSECFVASYASIAAELGCSQTQSRSYLRELRSLGAVFTTETQTPAGWIYARPWSLWDALRDRCSGGPFNERIDERDQVWGRYKNWEAQDGM